MNYIFKGEKFILETGEVRKITYYTLTQNKLQQRKITTKNIPIKAFN